MIQLLDTTALRVEYDEDQRVLQASGALALLVQPALNKMARWLAEEKPALVRENDIIATTWLPPIPSGPFRRLILSEARIAIGRFVPQTVSIEVTKKGGCYPESVSDGELGKEDIIKVIDQALDMGTCIITFSEGDPLLREDVLDLIRHVDPKKAVVNVFTRGLAMTPEMARNLKAAGLYNLLVGVYSVEPPHHDQVRGMAGAHQKAIEAIKMGLDADLLVTMSTHAVGGQVPQLLDLYDYAAELGVHEFSIWEGDPNTPQEVLTQIDKEKIVRFYKNINGTPGGPRVFANTYFEGEMVGPLAGRRWLHVDADGNVRPSPYVQESYGNVQDDSLMDAWSRMRRSKKFEGPGSAAPDAPGSTKY